MMLAFLSPLASCATQTPPALPTPTAATSACLVWHPIIFSRLHDTVETINQIKVQNAAHDALCGAKP
jgi:hypothetical protein